MANLKQDLVNNLGNEKYYEELELARLAQDPNAPYREKVDKMSVVLKNIASVDFAMQLVEKYFQEQTNTNQEPVQQENTNIPQQPVQQTHPGQSHGE